MLREMELTGETNTNTKHINIVKESITIPKAVRNTKRNIQILLLEAISTICNAPAYF